MDGQVSHSSYIIEATLSQLKTVSFEEDAGHTDQNKYFRVIII